ncbi:MAG: phosphate signaling complex protein PhoU [Liquorilactobacillus ghanensis]|uniref:phosphate signaling complex protein PhoU n=1 Tax=Liquorilactobacillus ghanensis TaxID=399370 RepID=UPI0039E75D13
MRETFDKELVQLHVRFAEMGMLVNEAIFRSVKAFVDHDKNLASMVIEHDQAINQCESQLEKMTLELIALYQPVTSDLRDVITVLKASSDIERIADHAVSLARTTIKMKGTHRIPEIEVEIAKMGEYAAKMVADALDAYVKRDLERAYQIAQQDLFLDQELAKIKQLCIAKMQANQKAVVSGSHYTLAATYLERIGDYATNVCEWIVFLKKGEIVELNPGNSDDENGNA